MLNYLIMTLGPGSPPDPNIYYRTLNVEIVGRAVFLFPFCFPLCVYRLDKLLHAVGAVLFHFLSDMAIDIKGERCRSMA